MKDNERNLLQYLLISIYVALSKDVGEVTSWMKHLVTVRFALLEHSATQKLPVPALLVQRDRQHPKKEVKTAHNVKVSKSISNLQMEAHKLLLSSNINSLQTKHFLNIVGAKYMSQPQVNMHSLPVLLQMKEKNFFISWMSSHTREQTIQLL